MAKKKIYKTVYTLEVLSDDPMEENVPMYDIVFRMNCGELSGIVKEEARNIPLEGKSAVREMEKHETSPEFFMMDKNGNEIEDY